MTPLPHLSLPVRRLDEAIAFYTDVLGCRVGRGGEGCADVWFFGMQLTLHERPDQVLPPESTGVRHFGATIGPEELEEVVAVLERRGVAWASAPSVDHAGTDREQQKAKLLDPSGNVIELKAYLDPGAALELPG